MAAQAMLRENVETFQRPCETVRLIKLPFPRIVKDVLEAMRNSTPFLQAANKTQEKILELLREVEDERSPLSTAERAARRREIDELTVQSRRGKEASGATMDDLKARYPEWIK
jgi:hypothetical protein